MSIEVRKYLMNLDDVPLDRSSKGYILDNGQLKSVLHRQVHTGIVKCKIRDKIFYLKDTVPFNAKLEGLNEIVLGKVYNDKGINSNISYPVLQEERSRYDSVKVLSQDISKLKGMDVKIADKAIGKVFDKYLLANQVSPWEILNNPTAKSEMLEYVTEECFNKIISMHLLDNLLTSADRHSNNYFMVRNKGSEKWEDIIAIDHSYLDIIDNGRICETPAESIKEYVKAQHIFIMPMDIRAHTSHRNRIQLINKLLDGGKLADENVELIKNALEYDLIGVYDKEIHKHGLKSRELDYDRELMARIWEYNREQVALR